MRAAAAAATSRDRSVFVRSVSRENGRVIKSIGAPASGEGSGAGPVGGLGRGGEKMRGDRRVRIIDIHGFDERARRKRRRWWKRTGDYEWRARPCSRPEEPDLRI